MMDEESGDVSCSWVSTVEKIKNQLENDDPALTRLTAGNERRVTWIENDDEEGWLRDGKLIGDNSHLKNLCLCFRPEDLEEDLDLLPFPSEQTFKKFFGGVARNRSVEVLIAVLPSATLRLLFETMAPFFKNNQILTSLEIHEGEVYGGEDGSSDRLPLKFDFPSSQIASALQEFRSLREFEISGWNISDADANRILFGLRGHEHLDKVTLHSVGTETFRSLGKLLRNPKSGLTGLTLRDITAGDEGGIEFACGLKANKSLKELVLTCGDGRGGCIVHDPANPAVGTMSIVGWQNIFDALPNLSLETLDLSENVGSGLNDVAIQALSNTLTECVHLKWLDVAENCIVTAVGWRSFFRVLEHPNCALQYLRLWRNDFRGLLGVHLVYSLRNNSTLKELCLGACELSECSFSALSSMLGEDHTGLEKIDLSNNSIDAATMRDFANSLRTNQTLQVMLMSAWGIEEEEESELDEVWEMFSQLLCNKQSIGETHSLSNHTLQALDTPDDQDELMIPGDVRHYLEINKNNTKSDAAHRKIIEVHFSGAKLDLECFVGMESGVLPHAVAWMARCSEAADLSLLFQYVPNLHSYFDASGKVEHESNERVNVKRQRV